MFANVERLVDVLGEDSAGEAELCVVCPLDDALHIPGVELGDDHDGAEALLLGDVHVVLHVAEDGRLHVQTRPDKYHNIKN